MAVDLYPAAHFRPPWICHSRLRPASFVTKSGLLAVCGGDFGGWSSPPVDTCEVLDSNTQHWRVDYRVPSVPQNISCQLFPGQSDCVRPARVHWTDSVTLPGIGVFLFGKPGPKWQHGERTLSVLLRTGSTSWVPTPGWIEPRQLRMDAPRGWSCIVALPKTNSILVIPDGRGSMDGRTNRVREFRASSGSEPGSWAPDELWPCLLQYCIDRISLEDLGCSVVSNKLIIAGGRDEWGWSGIASTTIIDLEKKTIKYAGDLNYPRFEHVMATLNGAVYAFGGQAWIPPHRPDGNPHGGRLIDTVEVWDMNMETWEVLDVKMARGRTHMAALVVDPKNFFLPFASGSGSGSESGDEYGKGFGTGNDYCLESGPSKP